MINEYLSYNPESGKIIWLRSKGTVRAGAIAGTPDIHGYCCIKFNQKLYKAHRIAWYLMTGSWPNMDIDHINRNPADNRWFNLRQCTHRENMGNMKTNTKFVGVNWKKHRNRWEARHSEKGVPYLLGYFKTHLAACCARHQYNIGLSDEKS